MARDIISIIQERNSVDSIVAITCDGCNVTTGKHGGVIKRVELKLDRPLQLLVCLLHLIELPLREMLRNIDGYASGPHSYQGKIGKKLQTDQSRVRAGPGS